METKTGFVTSKDGTTIGYRQVGQGPGLLILHGSMSTGYNHLQLAEGLADEFTVYLPDRRGRGLSGPYRDDHTIRRDIQDLDALLSKTGAQDVFGVSIGAIICLQAALDLPAIRRVALYEPPLLIKDPAALLKRFDAEMARGNTAAALVTAMRGTQMGPGIFNRLPRWLLELMTRQMISGMEKNGTGNYESFGALAPTLHYESQVYVHMVGKLDTFKTIGNEMLLLGGIRSASHFKTGLDVLATILPKATRVELPAVGHSASWNTDVGGKPKVVAAELRSFFSGSYNTGQMASNQEPTWASPALPSGR